MGTADSGHQSRSCRTMSQLTSVTPAAASSTRWAPGAGRGWRARPRGALRADFGEDRPAARQVDAWDTTEMECVVADVEKQLVDLGPADDREHAVRRAEPGPSLRSGAACGFHSSAFGPGGRQRRRADRAGHDQPITARRRGPPSCEWRPWTTTAACRARRGRISGRPRPAAVAECAGSHRRACHPRK